MVQVAFPFTLPARLARPTAVAAAAGQNRAAAPACSDHADPIGFEIGWDHAHHRLTPPLAHLHAENPVRQGWAAGRTAFGTRTLRASAAVRQWLALRLQAWQDGQRFEPVQVTPFFLARLDSGLCPVSRITLRRLTDRLATSQPEAAQPQDAVVQRLCPQSAYAAGNLAVTSRAVAQARAKLAWHEAWQQAQRIEAGECGAVRGLDANAWARLAVLASFATPMAHNRAACLPLRVMPPNRVRVINPVQALQVMLTLQFSQPGYARRVPILATLVAGADARDAFQVFMHTLLARRLAVGQPTDGPALRQAMEDSWTDPLLNRRWQRLALRLSAADCEELLQRAQQRGLAVGGCQWLDTPQATDGWTGPAQPLVAARTSSGAQKLAS